MQIITINPTTETILNHYSIFTKDQVNRLINAGHLCFQNWRKTSFETRKSLMMKLSNQLRQNQNQYAALMADEMGKPITAGKAEIEKCAWVCEHYASHAEHYLDQRTVLTGESNGWVCYQPLGIVFAIMPWNFPFWQVFRFAAPALMAGNAAILKHAPITTGCGNAIAKLFIDVGFPEYLFQHFILDNELAAEVIAHDKIIGMTLTGSEQAGRIVAANAGAHLKKSVLELGGNDPYLVLSDADLDLAADCIVKSRLNNSGQVCIAAKRVIVVKDCYDVLIEKIIQRVTAYTCGDPHDPSTLLGPMAREDLRKKLHEQVQESIAQGAYLRMGGEIPNRVGFYYPPTILTHVKPGMPAFDDELFGPVITLIAANDEREAIELANRSRFGLGAAIFTQDIKRGQRMAIEDIEAGSCFVNALVASDPRLPFGGIKHSGYGRELSQEGILTFVNTKTVVIHE